MRFWGLSTAAWRSNVQLKNCQNSIMFRGSWQESLTHIWFLGPIPMWGSKEIQISIYRPHSWQQYVMKADYFSLTISITISSLMSFKSMNFTWILVIINHLKHHFLQKVSYQPIDNTHANTEISVLISANRYITVRLNLTTVFWFYLVKY